MWWTPVQMFFFFFILLAFYSLKGFESSDLFPCLSCLVLNHQDVYDPSMDLFNNEIISIPEQGEETVAYISSSNSSPTKSILKSSSESLNSLDKPVKSVKFTEGTKLPEFEVTSEDLKYQKLKEVKDFVIHAYKTKEHEPLLCVNLYDYENESGNVWTNFDIPSDFAELIRTTFPALESVKITLNDLAGLVILASYHINLPYLYDLNKFTIFYNSFFTTFSSCKTLIKLMKINLDERIQTKIKALDELLKISFNKGYHYTIEAFFELLGDNSINIFIKNSIKYQNLKSFKRFVTLEHFLKPEKMVAWSIEYSNVPVFMELMQQNISIEGLCKKFDNPIVLSVVGDNLHFPGLIDLLAPIEGLKYFSEALTHAVTTKNIKNFKDLIKYDNSFLGKYHSLGYLNPMREVFVDGKTEDFTFETKVDMKIFILYLLNFDCDDKQIFEVYCSLIPEIINSNLREEVISKAIFLKTRKYLNLILNYPGQSCPFIVGLREEEYLGYYGIWEFVYDSKDYFDFMKNIVNLPVFNILYAIGNPNFPQSLWPQLIEKFKSQNEPFYIENQNYKNLCRKYGFTNDSNLNGLGLELNKNWSLLDLAILNFNPIAVAELLDHFGDNFWIDSSYELAKNYDSIINRSHSVLVPRILGRTSLYKSISKRHSDLFKKKSKVDPNELLEINLTNLKSIVRILRIKLDN